MSRLIVIFTIMVIVAVGAYAESEPKRDDDDAKEVSPDLKTGESGWGWGGPRGPYGYYGGAGLYGLGGYGGYGFIGGGGWGGRSYTFRRQGYGPGWGWGGIGGGYGPVVIG